MSVSSPTVASPASSESRARRAEPDGDGKQRLRDQDSDCESDTSEVLSVGNEPPPRLDDLEPSKFNTSRTDDELTARTSRTPSPASSTSSYRRQSPPGYSQLASSPGASSVRSPASSSMTASSPGRPELAQDATLPRYSSAAQQLLKYPKDSELDYPARLPHGLAHELAYQGLERLHRAPISVVTRLSLSPPSAMTVPGLQVSTPILHPTVCRDAGLSQQLRHGIANHLQSHHHHQQQQTVQQHLAATMVHQHKLSVNKILQRESPELLPRDEHQQLLLNGRCATNGSSGSDNHGHSSGNNNNNNSNNNNNTQHQASLKFSIDNILKADFGRRITDPISLKKSRPKKVAVRPIDLSKDFVESSSEGSERGSERSSETSTRNVSPSLSASSPAPSTTTPNSSGDSKIMQWPAWVYCTRYSDRPSSGRSPRTRRPKRPANPTTPAVTPDEKRPRTAFSPEQLSKLTKEFALNKYLNEQRRQLLSKELGLNEAQIKIWFQNKRAKIKKASGHKNPLALQLMAQGLYNHSTVPLSKEELEQAAELQAK